MRPRLSILFAVGLAIALLPAVGAVPERDGKWADARVLNDRFEGKLVGLAAAFDTEVAAGSILGALITLEGDLDYSENLSTMGVKGFYRFGRKSRHALAFDAVALDREATGTVETVIPIFDERFFGAYESEFNQRLLSLAWRYSLLSEPRGEAGITAGVSTYQFEFDFVGAAVLGDCDPASDPTCPITLIPGKTTDVLAPVPVVGGFLVFAIRPNLIFEGSVAFTDLDIGNSSGRIFSGTGELTWYVIRNFGLGIGFGGADILYKSEKSGDRLSVDYRQNGALVFVSGVF